MKTFTNLAHWASKCASLGTINKKRYYLFFITMLLTLGVGNAWAEEVTFSWAGASTATAGKTDYVVETAPITLTFAAGTAQNAPRTNKEGSVRMYANTTLTISCASGNITEVVFTPTGNTYNATKLSYNGTALTSDNWTLSSPSNEVTLTATAAARFKSIVVTYTPTGGGETPDPTSVTISLDKTELSLQEGENATLTATVTGSTESVTWTSSKIAVATVDNTGKVTAVAAGEATITAAIGDVKATCTVTVTAAPVTPDPGTGEAGSYTWDLSKNTYTKGTDEVTWTADGIATMHNAGTNATNYLGGDSNNRSSSRFYSNNTLTITPAANVTITSVEFTATSSNYATTLKNSTWNNATASVSGSVVTVTPTNGASAISATVGGTCGFTGVTVNYTKAASDEPQPVIVKTLKSIAVTPTTITYEQGDVFSFDGTCTATYSVTKDGVAQEDETKEVTPTSVSTPDMNTVGTQTVFVTYSEGGVEKTAEYTITITENIVTAGTYCTGKLGYAFWGLSAEKTTATANEVDYTRMFNDITINIKNGAKANAYFKEDHTRVYSGGYTMTFTAPVNYVITAISFTPDAGNNWAGTHTANVGTMTDSKNWTGSANEVTITFGGTCRITDICVSYEAAPVEPVKTLTSIEITTPATQTTFWQGETFNYDDLVVTAHYSDAEDEIITPTVTGSTATAGTATVTVSYKEQSTSYAITVKAIPNSKETAYTVADAFGIIDKLTTANGVFIKGIVSQVDSYNETYKSITYWISADGTTTKQLQVYSGKGLESADFAAVTDLSVGDQVIVCGNLKKYSGTYEFDKNNYLASHTPTTKDPAGLVYATTSYTANVGEPFTTPELTNPHTLVVTYSTSDASKATVDVNTGAVTIVAAGEVTITASTTGDATHDAGSASYTITISNPAMAVATLPFAFDNGKADIENTPGMSQNGLGSDYGSAPLLKFDGTGDYVIIHFNGEPGKLSYDIKGNSYSGGTFIVQESADGSAYTNIVEYAELGSTETKTHTLDATSRYVKFIYTEKVNGNVALGNIKIALPEEEPGEGGGETPEERLTEWVLTPLADITTNDLVVITMTKGETTWAMTNDKGTDAAPVASVVTLSADALAAEPDANLKWVVSNDNGTLTIYPYGTYETWLYCTNTNNGVRVGKGDAKEFTINANYLYTSLTTDPRHIGVYESNNDWRCYKPSSGAIATNIAGQTLAFYVKKNANDVLPGTGEDPEGGEGGEDPVVPTINPTTTFIFNTAEGLNDLGIAYPTTEDEDNVGAYKTNLTDGASFTQDGITMTSTDGTTVTRVWLTTAGKLDLRVYKNATLTFSVPAEHKISAIVFDGSNIGHLLVNETAVSGNAWTGSEQTVTFTAKADASTIKINTIAFVVEYTRNVTNKYGTICLPYGSTNYAGATFYRVAGKETGKVYLESVSELEAGVPYIFEKTASQIKVTYEGEAVDAPINTNANGLVGNFTNEYVVPANNYILYNNAFIPADGTTNKVNAYRAYLNMDAVTGGAPQQMPGRRYIGMAVTGENEATGFENITAPEGQTIKAIINGQLIIIRDGEKFNAQGQKL